MLIMKKKLKKYSVGGFKPPKITQADINKVQQMEANTRLSKLTEDMSLASGILKGTNFATGAIADFVNNQNNTQFENEQYYKSLRNTGEDEFVQNDIPLYTKYGGGFPRDKALKILRDKKVNGKPLTDKQRKFFAVMAFKKAMEGIDLTESPEDMYRIMEEGGPIGRPTLAEIAKMKDKNRYEPSDRVKNLKAVLSSASAVPNPLISLPASALSAIADATTAFQYYIDDNPKKASEDIIQAGISLLPGTKVVMGMKGAYKASRPIVRGAKAASDVKTVGDSKLSDPVITRGHIDYSMEPEFRKRNPNFNHDSYVRDNSKFGRTRADISEDMIPFDLKKLPSIKREEYRATQRKIMDDKYNNPLDQKQEGGELPEVTVYGHRGKGAKSYFDRLRQNAELYQDWGNEAFIAEYKAKEQLHNKYGSPKINVIGKNSRAHYNFLTDTLNLNQPQLEEDGHEDTFLAELSHKIQGDKKGKVEFTKDFVSKDLLNTLKNIDAKDLFNKKAWKKAYDNNYESKDSIEHEAHKTIYPKLMEEFIDIAMKEFEKNPKNKKQEGGQFNNSDMLELMQEGGIPQRYKAMGFSRVGQKKASTRDGKKWMVLAKKGDKYKVVHGGAKGMSDYTKHKDEDRKDRFWKRHNAGAPGKSKDPFSPLYWHKRFGTWQEGGEIPEVEGLPDGMEHQAWIEAEAGEVYQQPDGQILKIDEDGDRHEDGGELITNVERVLEDTSTTRRDKKSKALAITPDKMKAMFGMEVDKNLSHSEALEVVSKKLDKDTSKIKSKLNKVLKALDTMPSNKYAQNSLEFNTMELSKYPSKEEVFDMLFEHQESLKQERDMKQAKYGIQLPKAQDGLELLYQKAKTPGAKKADIEAFQKAFHADSRTKSFAQNLIDSRKNITSYGKKMGYGKGNLKMNEDGLLGETTTSYFDYFKNNVAAPAPVAAPAAQPAPVEAPAAPAVDPMAGIDYGLWTGGDEAPAATTSTTTTKEVKKDEEEEPLNATQYSDFNEPLSWTDIASPSAAYLSADRMPARYNPAKFSKVTARMENVLPYLQQGQRDFNAITAMVDNSGSGQANLANVFAQKYAVDNQTRGAVTDRNLQRQSQADMYNAQVSDKQSVADQQARAVFEQQQLLGMEAQRKQKLQSLDEIMKRVNLNKKQNREGDLLMKLFPNFDSYGNYNQNRRYLSSGATREASGGATSQSRFTPVQIPMPNGQMVQMLLDNMDGKVRPISNNKDMSNTRNSRTPIVRK